MQEQEREDASRTLPPARHGCTFRRHACTSSATRHGEELRGIPRRAMLSPSLALDSTVLCIGVMTTW